MSEAHLLMLAGDWLASLAGVGCAAAILFGLMWLADWP